jgi:hypothetical protein
MWVLYSGSRSMSSAFIPSAIAASPVVRSAKDQNGAAGRCDEADEVSHEAAALVGWLAPRRSAVDALAV